MNKYGFINKPITDSEKNVLRVIAIILAFNMFI